MSLHSDNNYELRLPHETAVLTTGDGTQALFPVYKKLSNNKDHIRCDLCHQYFVLNAARVPTNLANHRGNDTCQKVQDKRDRMQLVLSTEAEASAAVLNLFHRQNQSEISSSGPATPRPSTPTTPTFSTTKLSFSQPVNDEVISESQIVGLTKALELRTLSDDLLPLDYNSDSDDEVPELVDLPDDDSEEEMAMATEISGYLPLASNICQGQRVEWTPGSVWETFPYQQHADNTLGWRPVAIEDQSWIRVKSSRCAKDLRTQLEQADKTCIACMKVVNSTSFRRCLERSEGTAAAYTPWKYLNARQLRLILVDTRKKASDMRWKILTLSRKVEHLNRKLNDHQRIIMLLAQKKISGVTEIMAVALRRGASPASIYDRLQMAITTTYSPRRKWTQREFDIAFLIKALGGPRLLFALQKEEGYPSLTTLRNRKPIPELTISTQTPDKSEFDSNITAFLGSSGRQPPSELSVGQVLMIDGVALEETCRFDLKRNCVLGLCREHSMNIKLTIDTPEDINNIADALFRSKSIHHGKDGTVVAIAPITGSNSYFPVPVVLSGSCKSEKGKDMAEWIPAFLEAYRVHPDGQARHGPIHTFATDGESSFRNLRFRIGLTHPLDPMSDLGKVIYQLRGMNVQTGANGLLTTSDPKHIIKRFATMIRSPTGIQIAESSMSMEMVRDALLLLKDMSKEKVLQLLHPADKQNVPKAVNLLQCLGDLDGVADVGSPSLKQRLQRLAFLSKSLALFLNPFIDVTMSLAQQLRSLSAYSHLITAMYRRHRTAFLTSALFADSQAIVKNIFFTAARLKGMGILHYYILFEGTDRLEGVFSHARTQDHSRNFDMLQLSQKLSIGAEINAIFERRPDLDRGHVRRNLVNMRGVDHVNPASWRGDTSLAQVDIIEQYNLGRIDANSILETHLGTAENFEKLFSESNIDHLRPFGRYIGSSIDASKSDAVIPEANSDDADEEALDFDGVIQHEEMNLNSLDLRDTLTSDSDTNSSMFDTAPEDYLNPSPENTSSRLMVEGKNEYKPTLIARMLSSEAGKKVTTRPLRARGVAVSDALQARMESLNLSSMNTDSADLVKSGDLGAFLMRLDDQPTVCLAVVEVMSFQRGSNLPITSIPFDDLDLSGTNTVSVICQVLELKASQHAGPALNWIWPSSRKFIQVHGKTGAPMSQQNYMLRIPGSFFYPVGPDIFEDGYDLPTWSLPDSNLQQILEHAWSSVYHETDNAQTSRNIQNISALSPGFGLPYTHPQGSPHFTISVNPLITLPIGSKSGESQISCRICDKLFPLSEMRSHVGQHILLSQRECQDKSAKREVGANPCGWCGLDKGCVTQLIETRGSISTTSNCEYHYAKMIYSRALIPSQRSPSTNVPISCPLCAPNGETQTFWKYNLLYHMMAHHLQDDGSLPPFPRKLLVRTHITKAEEVSVGVDQLYTNQYRQNVGWPQSDALTGPEDEDIELHRKRAGSVISDGSTQSRQPSPTKRSFVST